MLLAIDIGNTNTSFAVFIGERLRADWRVSTRASRTADEYAAILHSLMTRANMEASGLNCVVISSVVPAALDPLIPLLQETSQGRVTDGPFSGYGFWHHR